MSCGCDKTSDMGTDLVEMLVNPHRAAKMDERRKLNPGQPCGCSAAPIAQNERSAQPTGLEPGFMYAGLSGEEPLSPRVASREVLGCSSHDGCACASRTTAVSQDELFVAMLANPTSVARRVARRQLNPESGEVLGSLGSHDVELYERKQSRIGAGALHRAAAGGVLPGHGPSRIVAPGVARAMLPASSPAVSPVNRPNSALAAGCAGCSCPPGGPAGWPPSGLRPPTIGLDPPYEYPPPRLELPSRDWFGRDVATVSQLHPCAASQIAADETLIITPSNLYVASSWSNLYKAYPCQRRIIDITRHAELPYLRIGADANIFEPPWSHLCEQITCSYLIYARPTPFGPWSFVASKTTSYYLTSMGFCTQTAESLDYPFVYEQFVRVAVRAYPGTGWLNPPVRAGAAGT
jgi:hypothetical protein